MAWDVGQELLSGIPRFSCRFSGCADVPRARCWWGGKGVCAYRGRPVWGKEFILVALDVCSSTGLLPGSHNVGDSLPRRGRCLQKKKSKELRASPWDLGFCCMQQEAPYILCVGGNTLCRHSFVPHKVKTSRRWAKSPYSHPVCRRNSSKLCGDWNFITPLHRG